MPTFYAAGTTIQLSTAPLDNVITTNPIQSKCPQTTKEVEDISYEFAEASKAGTLNEDALKDELTGSNVRFLGKNRDLPFFMVGSGKKFFDDVLERGQKRTKRAARIPPPKQTVEVVPVNEGILAAPGTHTTDETSGVRISNGKLLSIEKWGRDIVRLAFGIGGCQHPVQDTSQDHDPGFVPPAIPHALCLTVFLSPTTFIRTNVKEGKKSLYHDIKVLLEHHPPS